MNEADSSKKQPVYDVDNCRHRLVYDQEWVCNRCGRVFTADEAEELQKGSAKTTTVTTYEDLGLDPHGRTPLWLTGLGSIEGYTHLQQSGDRDDISILSNIASKLELPSYAAMEFLQLYCSFMKDRKKKGKDRVYAAKLAILDMLEKYPVLVVRFMRMLRYMKGRRVSNREVIQYISTVIDMQFGRKTANKKKDEEKDDRDNNNEEYDSDTAKILPWMNSLDLGYIAKRYGPVTATNVLNTIIRRR